MKENTNTKLELADLAKKYVWWKTPDEAIQYPDRIILQVMNIGDYDDTVNLIKLCGKLRLKMALKKAEIGQLNEKSWHYWHYRLGLAKHPAQIPDLPNDRFHS